MRHILIAAGLLMAHLSPVLGLRAEERSAEEAAIRANAQKYVAAFNAGDAAALAALWSPEAVYVDSDTGKELKGREAIAARFTSLFRGAAERPKLDLAVMSVRIVTSDVAIEDGIATVVTPSGASSQTSYTAVSVKKEGTWLLDSVRETSLPLPPTAFDRLQPLAWLEGEWVDSGDDATLHMVFRWAANGAFLTQTFTALTTTGVEMRGTQIIGWDPVRQEIRSWLFDSDGGFGEGRWELQNGQWNVHQSMTLPDGRTAAAINVLRPVDGDAFTWKSTARQVGGELLPNVDERTVIRFVESLSDPASGSSSVPAASRSRE